MPLKPLDYVGVSMYVSEIRELVDSLLFRIDIIKRARDAWLAHESEVAKQIQASHDDFSLDVFNSELAAEVGQQSTIFDTFEALLAAWARLSLMFHPIVVGKSEEEEWRRRRGDLLRMVFELRGDTLLSSRTFRDSWMHFDERMDRAFLEGWLGNRQQFVKATGIAGALKHSVRVIDIEGLAFHYRTRDGKLESVTLDHMRSCLIDVESRLVNIGPRIVSGVGSP